MGVVMPASPPPTPLNSATRNPRKGNSKKQEDIGFQPSEAASGAPSAILFPKYSSSTATPLPPPSMPKKRFFRRAMPFLVAAAAAGAYVLRTTSKKQAAEEKSERDRE